MLTTIIAMVCVLVLLAIGDQVISGVRSRLHLLRTTQVDDNVAALRREVAQGFATIGDKVTRMHKDVVVAGSDTLRLINAITGRRRRGQTDDQPRPGGSRQDG